MAPTEADVKAIPGFHGYAATRDGRILSIQQPAHMRYLEPSWRELKPHVTSKGYAQVTLFKDGKRYLRHVHALVLTAFLGPRKAGQQACHGNGVPGDNRLENLRWDTVAANHCDKRLHGTMPRGEGHRQSKLTGDQVKEIRRLKAAGASSMEIGRRFGVSGTWVGRIVTNKNWTHI